MAAIETTLGAKTYSIVIAERSGRVLFQSTEYNLDSVKWSREYCNTTSATATFTTIPYIANAIEPWVHTLAVYRGDLLVWFGMVRKVRAKANTLEVTGYDGSVYWGKRRTGQKRTYRNRDAAAIAMDVITDAISRDDPLQQVEAMTMVNSGIWMTVEIPVALKLVKDVMEDLEKQGLAWTFSGGRLILGPLPSTHTCNQLTDEHWSADIEVIKEGGDVVTDCLAIGKGVFGYYADHDQSTGVLQSITKADSMVREEECSNEARRVVEEAKYAPRQVVVPSSSRLLPGAPITMDELVPGVLIPISSRQTGITVGATMALKSVTVTSDSKGENVSISLMEVPSNTDPSLLPQKVEEDYSSPYDREKRDKEQVQTDSTATADDTDGPGPA